MLQAFGDLNLEWQTQRLLLEPVIPDHALEMAQVLSDPLLYRYIPEDPPTVATLQERYQKWLPRISPLGDELWLNWVARRKCDDALIGFFQAGLDSDGLASIAYMVGLRYQRCGYAFEALRSIFSMLKDSLGATYARAWIDSRNEVSISLARKLGMLPERTIYAADFFKGSSSDEIVYGINLSS